MLAAQSVEGGEWGAPREGGRCLLGDGLAMPLPRERTSIPPQVAGTPSATFRSHFERVLVEFPRRQESRTIPSPAGLTP